MTEREARTSDKEANKLERRLHARNIRADRKERREWKQFKQAQIKRPCSIARLRRELRLLRSQAKTVWTELCAQYGKTADIELEILRHKMGDLSPIAFDEGKARLDQFIRDQEKIWFDLITKGKRDPLPVERIAVRRCGVLPEAKAEYDRLPFPQHVSHLAKAGEVTAGCFGLLKALHLRIKQDEREALSQEKKAKSRSRVKEEAFSEAEILGRSKKNLAITRGQAAATLLVSPKTIFNRVKSQKLTPTAKGNIVVDEKFLKQFRQTHKRTTG